MYKFIVESDVQQEKQRIAADAEAAKQAVMQAKEEGADPIAATAKGAAALGETALTFGTGLVATAVGGAYGLGKSMVEGAKEEGIWKQLTDSDPEVNERAYQKGIESMQWIQENLTYQPRTEGGQKTLETIAVPFVWLEEKTTAAGGAVSELTGSAAAGTAVKTGLEFVPIMWFTRGANAIKNKVKGNTLEASEFHVTEVEHYIKEVYKENPGAKKNVLEAKQVMEQIPDVDYTTGQIIGTAGGKNLQKKSDAANLSNLTRSEIKFQQNKEAIDTYTKKVLGSERGDVNEALKAAGGDFAKGLKILEAKEAVQIQMAVKKADIFRKTDAETAGAYLRKVQRDLYTNAKGKGEILYNMIGDAQIPFTTLWTKMEAIQSLPTNLAKDIPDTFKMLEKMRGRITPGGITEGRTSLSMTEARAVLRSLKDEAASNRGSLQTNGNKGRIIDSVIKEIEGEGGLLDTLLNSADANVVKNYTVAKNFWRDGVVNRFKKGPASGWCYTVQ
jgi:hypothetical protein